MSSKSNRRRKAVNAAMASGHRPPNVARLNKTPDYLSRIRLPHGGIFDPAMAGERGYDPVMDLIGMLSGRLKPEETR